MQASSKLLTKSAIMLLGVLLAAVVFVVIIQSQQANALLSTEQQYVADNLNAFVSAQIDQYADEANAFNDGEGGFIRNAKVGTGPSDPNWSKGLVGQVNSNGDATYLGEGDDLANFPVLVDAYTTDTKWIPGTPMGLRIANTATFTSGAPGNIEMIRGQVALHNEAGMSTDIVSYCLTGHTESPPVMGLGALSQAGYFNAAFANPADAKPKVLALRWGRGGWGSLATASYANPVAAAGTTYAAAGNSPFPTVAGCSSGNTAETVRCRAAAAQTLVNAGVGAPGAAGGAAWSATNNYPVDLREGTPAYTVSGSSPDGVRQIALRDMFTTAGLQKLPIPGIVGAGKKNIMINRSQHTAAMAAMGASMVGYSSDYLRWGLPSWNKTAGANPGWYDTEHYTTTAGQTYWNSTTGGQSTGSSSGGYFRYRPDISSVSSGAPGTTTATLTWNTTWTDGTASGVAPSTSKVEYGTTLSYGTVSNDTVLHSSHSVDLTGLTPNTTYYYRLTSFDAGANKSEQVTGSFVTQPDCSTTAPTLSLAAPAPFWGSFADYTARKLSVTWTVNNTGAVGATNVQITGSTPNGAVTLITAMPVSIGAIAAGSSGSTVIQYNVPVGYGGFHVWNSGSAQDECGTATYTYPV